MNKTTVSLFFLLSFTLLSFSQEKIKGNKVVTIIETHVEPFNKISIGEKFNISLVKSFQDAVEIETDENLHDVIEFKVEDSTLSFKTTHKITSKKKLNIIVKYANELEHIITKENSELNAVSTIKSDTLNIDTFGNSKVALSLNCKKFNFIHGEKSKAELTIESNIINLDLFEHSKIDAKITSDSLIVKSYKNANAKLEGEVNYLNLTATESSNFKGKNLKTNTSNLIAKGSSDVSIQTKETITIEASEKSEIHLYGNPKITLNEFTDTSKLSKKEL